jgi:acyl phosphate:glycerol-3-phosphate acyltransferase
MAIVLNVLLLAGAYLLGSIPTAVWVGRFFFNSDIRDYGSGNAGATNTIRVFGWKPGIIVMIVDLMKGFAAVKLAFLSTTFLAGSEHFVNFKILLGVLAIIGHIFPIFAGFRGGKGVATLFGVILSINPFAALISVGVFLLCLAITQYVSLSSMVAGLAFPVTIVFIIHTTYSSLVLFSLLVAILLMITHQKNIERLLNRQESKATFLWKKSRN